MGDVERLLKRGVQWNASATGSGFGVHMGAGTADGTPVVAIEGELDLATASLLRDGLAFATSMGTSGQVILDASCLRFADVAGVRAVAAADQHIRQTGGAGVRVRGATGIVRRVFELTELAGLLDDPPSGSHRIEVPAEERRALDAARCELGASVTELYIHYFALGGTATPAAFAAHLRGETAALERREHDLIVDALREHVLDDDRQRARTEAVTHAG